MLRNLSFCILQVPFFPGWAPWTIYVDRMQASYWAAPLNCWRMTRWLTSGLSPRHDMNLGFSGCIPEQHKLEVKLRLQRSKLVLAAKVFKTLSASQSLTTMLSPKICCKSHQPPSTALRFVGMDASWQPFWPSQLQGDPVLG